MLFLGLGPAAARPIAEPLIVPLELGRLPVPQAPVALRGAFRLGLKRIAGLWKKVLAEIASTLNGRVRG